MPTDIDTAEHTEDNFFTPVNHEFYDRSPYSELDPTRHEIRLLELLPANASEPLQVKLLTSFFLLSNDVEAPNYLAISYFAGNHKETEIVYVDGVRFNAFANLARALRQVIHAREKADFKDYPQLVWADQICINQSNLSERSHQVDFMRLIYESAKIVLACLGWEDPSNGNWVAAVERVGIEPTSDIVLKDRNIYVKDHLFADFHDKDFQDHWTHLGHVLNSEWWRRGWVYQEVLVAQEVIVLFGVHSVRWDKLVPAVLAMDWVMDSWVEQVRTGIIKMQEDPADSVMTIGFRSEFAKFVFDGRRDWEAEGQMAIRPLLFHAQQCKVTDIRDQIFAFVGLADPGYRIIADYTSNLSTALRLLCKRIILYERQLDILRWSIKAGPSPDGRQQRTNIPTWTPDWTHDNVLSDLILHDRSESQPFRASADHRPTPAFLSKAGIPDCILRAQCLFVDELCSPASPSLSPGPEFSKVLQWWEQIAGVQQNPSGDEVHVYNAFMNTALRGMLQFWEGTAAGPEIQTRLTESLEYGDFFQSPKGYFVLIKKGVKPRHSDQICILLGSDGPFVLRKADDHYILISDAYVEGLMYGEAIQLMQQEELVVETIDIH